MPAAVNIFRQQRAVRSVFAPHELADMQSVVDAVCVELGVTAREKARRRAVAERVMAAHRRDGGLPLSMVNAGLAEPAAREPHATA